ncbi:cyclic AMP-dependent transcription factor ATF-3-like [Amphiura filiformis]|uniref:cyclic AMP-dependent transcription factor ATF-3-like n=1 Tax=Amphiura filiformis TaxID=82378 RepID=UPI003B20CE06
MVNFKHDMTNDDTLLSDDDNNDITNVGGVVSPGLPESEASEGDTCSLPDEVFDALGKLEFNLSPLIKEELRTTIRNRRFGSGMEELVIDDSPKEPVKLTAEEEEKRRVRRDRNRIAAIKCRKKRKSSAQALEEEWEQQQTLHKKLQSEVDQLEAEKQKLMHMMQAHRPSCIIRTENAIATPENVGQR